MCSFLHPEHGLLKPFFDQSLELSPQSRQSYFIRTNLCSNFDLDVGLAPSINRKMVLINRVQDRKMNIFRHGTGCFKKFVSPYWSDSILKELRIYLIYLSIMKLVLKKNTIYLIQQHYIQIILTHLILKLLSLFIYQIQK